jgi:hypothetical protein
LLVKLSSACEINKIRENDIKQKKAKIIQQEKKTRKRKTRYQIQ